MRVLRHLLSRCASDHKLVIVRLLLTNNGRDFKIQPDSPLLRLPGELRNKIYDHLFDDCTVEVARYQRKVYTVYSCDYSVLLQLSRQVRKEVFSYLLDHAKFYVKYQDLSGLCRRFEGAERISTLAIDLRSRVMHGQTYNVDWMIKKLSPLCENGNLQRVLIKAEMTPRLYRVTLDLNLDLPDGPDGRRVRVEEDPDWSNFLRQGEEELSEGECSDEGYGQEGGTAEGGKDEEVRVDDVEEEKGEE
jgi:hypothetical protein